jgi:hypothetical protein
VELLALLSVGSVMAAVVAVGVFRIQAAVRSLRDAVRQLGLPESTVGGFFRPELLATVDGFSVTATYGGSSTRNHGLVLRVSSPDLLPQRLELGPEDLGTSIAKVFLGEDVQVGDRAFDAAVKVRGDPPLVAALMTDEARRAVKWFVDQGGRVSGGTLSMECAKGAQGLSSIARLIRDTLALAHRLSTPASLPGSLAANACGDPLPGVRLTNLQHLLDRYPSRRETTGTCRTLLTDRDTEVRMTAARALGEEGLATLADLVRDPVGDEYVASLALSALGPHLPGNLAADVLDRAVFQNLPGLAGAAIEALGRIGDKAAVARLVRLVDGDRPLIAAIAVRSLGSVTSEAAVARLVAILGSPNGELRTAAAEALGRNGGISVVSALHAAASRHPLDLGLRKAVAGAIAAIQSRAGDVAPGRLALAASDPGTLALADEVRGNVTLAGRAGDPEAPALNRPLTGPSRSGGTDHPAPRPDSRGKLRE